MSLREELVATLAEDVHEECGWLSDAQDAQLAYDPFNEAVQFCGEGSIDLGHLVGLVLQHITTKENQ